MKRIIFITLIVILNFSFISYSAPIRKTITITGSIIRTENTTMIFGLDGKNETVYSFEISNKKVMDAIGKKCRNTNSYLCEVYAIIDTDNKIIENVISVKKVK